MAQDDSLSEGDSPVCSHGRVDWDAVRHDFLYSGLSQRCIAAKHGTTADTLRKYMRAGGWQRSVPLQRRRTARGAAPTTTQTRRGRLVERLFEVLEAKIAAVEARMAETTDSSAPPSAADIERDARSLNALAQLYAKLVALDTDNDRSGPTSPPKDGNDADRLRRELADRLARLDRARDI